MSPCDPIDRMPPPDALLAAAEGASDVAGAALPAALALADAGLAAVGCDAADPDAGGPDAEVDGAVEGVELVHAPTTMATLLMATSHQGARLGVISMA